VSTEGEKGNKPVRAEGAVGGVKEDEIAKRGEGGHCAATNHDFLAISKTQKRRTKR